MITAIILAGGKGKRMGYSQSKQYIPLNGKPILYYTLDKFIKNELIDRVILVLPKEEISYCIKNVIEEYDLIIDEIVEGGKERQESVYNALAKIKGSELVLIHDAARPFVSDKIIEDGIRYAKIYGAAAPGVMPKDTIKKINREKFCIETPNRNELMAVQTPQIFDFNLIYECHKKIRQKSIQVTDDTMVAEYFGNKVYLYEGDYFNIKITTPEDLILAEYLVKKL